MPISESMQPTIDAYVRQDWVHRDERYRSLPVFMRRGVACEFDFTTPEAMSRSPSTRSFFAHRVLNGSRR
jgi:hypothetical protein